MKLMVTGAGGFVGRHVCAAAELRSMQCVPVVRTSADAAEEAVDLLDRDAIGTAVARIQPDAVIHTAASPSWQGGDQDTAAREERAMAENVLEATVALQPQPPIVFLGSAAEYGDLGAAPIDEEADPRPVSAYGKTKAALARELVGDAAQAPIWARVFNLLGPGQPPNYPVADWARQIANAGASDEIRVGALEVVRDFLDVRDAAEILVDLAERAPEGAGVVNVCSGEGIQLGELLDRLIRLSDKSLTVVADPELASAAGPAVAVGNPAKLHRLLGPPTATPLDRSLSDVLAAATAPN